MYMTYKKYRTTSQSHRSKRIYSCWFEPQPLDVTACKLCSLGCYHTHTHQLSYCMQTLRVQKSEPGVWRNDLNMIKMWNVTKQYSPRGGESRMSTSFLIDPPNCLEHVGKTYAVLYMWMWMTMQSHQTLHCVCNILSINAGQLVSSDG